MSVGKSDNESGIIPVLVDVPDDLMREVDRSIDKGSYRSRPEAFTFALRLVAIYTSRTVNTIDGMVTKDREGVDGCINAIRNYILIDQNLVRKYGRKESDKNVLIKAPEKILNSIRNNIKSCYEYDDISSKDLLKYALAFMLHFVIDTDDNGKNDFIYYSFSNSTEVIGKTIHDVLYGDVVPDCKPKENMYIGPRGVPKYIVDGKEYVQKKINKP